MAKILGTHATYRWDRKFVNSKNRKFVGSENNSKIVTLYTFASLAPLPVILDVRWGPTERSATDLTKNCTLRGFFLLSSLDPYIVAIDETTVYNRIIPNAFVALENQPTVDAAPVVVITLENQPTVDAAPVVVVQKTTVILRSHRAGVARDDEI